jgi:hypothetical protein
MVAARDRLDEYISAAMDTHTRINVVFSLRAVPGCYKGDSWGNEINSVQESVKKRDNWKGAAIQSGLQGGSGRIFTVRSRYQRKAGEDTAGWKRFSVCCGDLSVEISDCM